MQLAQLLLVDFRGRLRQQILGALRLREGDHVADRFGAGHHGDDAVQAEGDAAVRRRAILQRVQQVAELLAGFLGADLQRAEHLALHFLAVDTDRAAADFPAVQHHVVGLGERLAGIGFQEVFVAVLGAGERVVGGGVAAVFLVVFEHREVDHPQRLPAGREQTRLLAEFAVADLDAQRADGVVDDFLAVRAKEDDVAVLGAGALDQFSQRGIVQVLDDGRLQAVAALGHVVDLDVGQALGAIDADELGVGVDLAARHFGAARHAQGDNTAARRRGGGGKHLEVHVAHDVGDVGEFELHAQIGLVRAVAAHRFGPRHDRERRRQVDALHHLEHVADQVFEDLADFEFVQERGFAVDLGEFRLTVRAQVFVTEALGDLVVTVKARDHQHLLEQLRRLRQREEVAGVHTRGHKVVARAFGRALGQHGGFDVDEAQLVQELAGFDGHAVAQHQVALHLRTAQVQHAVREAGGFRQVVVVQLERRGDRRVQDLDFLAEHFDFAGGQFGVGRARRTLAHQAGDADAEFIAQALGGGEGGVVRIEHDLRQARAVAQVDEDDPAVVAAAVHPAVQGDGLAEMVTANLAGVAGTHAG